MPFEPISREASAVLLIIATCCLLLIGVGIALAYRLIKLGKADREQLNQHQ